MLSTILVYVSLFLQVAAAVIAISLFKRTKFNASWILISVGFLLMVVSRVFDLWPTIYPEMEDELAIVQKILAFIIALVLLIGVFYIRKIFQFMRRVDEIRRESEKRVLAAVIGRARTAAFCERAARWAGTFAECDQNAGLGVGCQ